MSMEQEFRSFGERLSRLESQVSRIISDIESEKGTRQRQDDRIEEGIDEVNTRLERSAEARDKKFEDMDKRIGRLEKVILLAAGAFTVLHPLVSKLVDMVSAL